MKKSSQPIFVVFSLLIFLFCQNLFSCTIFCASKNGKVLAAGNEDWSDPFSKIWISEKTNDRYGIINLGHSDYQVQTAINEFGLFFDFAAIPKAEGKNIEGKIKPKYNMFTEILATCKTIEEALEYLNKYEYPSVYNQVIMADASGKSVIVNSDIVLESDKNYQIATNFNTCNVVKGDFNCRRYQIINDGISKADDISVSLFRKLLSNTHQEGEYPTQYSYIFDLKNGIINLYSFHNYENVVVLNVNEELAKGYRMINLKELFPISFEEEYFRKQHRDTLTHKLIEEIKVHGAQAGLSTYNDAVEKNPDAAAYPFVLLSVAGGLVHESWFEDNDGKVFDYWFHPHNVLRWKSRDKSKLKDILKIYDYLESTIPKENPKQFIGTYELKGLLYYLIDEKEKSKQYFKKTIVVAPIETSNYQRAKFFIDTYF